MGPYTIPIPCPPPPSRTSNVCNLSGELHRAGSSTESTVSSGSTEITGLWSSLSCKLSMYRLVRADKKVDCVDKWLTEKSSICPYCNRCARQTSLKVESDCRHDIAKRWWRREVSA
jgi:hypothetical protein